MCDRELWSVMGPANSRKPNCRGSSWQDAAGFRQQLEALMRVGPAERAVQELDTMMRAWIITSGIPMREWCFVVEHMRLSWTR